MFPDSPDMRERDRRTAEAFADPRPGDRFHEMFSWWMVVITAGADGVKAMSGSGPTNLVRGRFPAGEIVEPFPERAEVRWYATAQDFRDGFRYGSIPGYTVMLADRGLDVSGWLERAKSAPEAPTHPKPQPGAASSPAGVMPDPRVFFFALSARAHAEEVPLDYLRQRRRDVQDPATAAEVAPGVRMALLGTGDFLLPGGTAGYGALVAVWADAEAPAVGRGERHEVAAVIRIEEEGSDG